MPPVHVPGFGLARDGDAWTGLRLLRGYILRALQERTGGTRGFSRYKAETPHLNVGGANNDCTAGAKFSKLPRSRFNDGEWIDRRPNICLAERRMSSECPSYSTACGPHDLVLNLP